MLMRQFSCKENRKTFAGYIKTQSGGGGYTDIFSAMSLFSALARLLNQIQQFFFEKKNSFLRFIITLLWKIKRDNQVCATKFYPGAPKDRYLNCASANEKC
jgi:hypothetical protein